METPQHHRILVAEGDPDIREFIANQLLRPSGFEVETAETANEALTKLKSFSPDIILTNLMLPDLSARDLLVAFKYQGVDNPVILIAPEGMEKEVIHAFHLGAFDFVQWPVRETELIHTIERALDKVQVYKERLIYANQLQLSNKRLNRRYQELAQVIKLSDVISQIKDEQALLQEILHITVAISAADLGWITLCDTQKNALILHAIKNVPRALESQLNEPFYDGISSLVVLTGKMLKAPQNSLQGLRIASLGDAALGFPIRQGNKIIGSLVLMRASSTMFNEDEQTLVKAVMNLAAHALTSIHLANSLEETNQKLQNAQTDQQTKDHDKQESIHRIIEKIDSLPQFESEG